jgi:hypothetical protein
MVLGFGYVVRFLGTMFEAGEVEGGEGENSMQDERVGNSYLGDVDAETGYEAGVVGESVGCGDVVMMKEF